MTMQFPEPVQGAPQPLATLDRLRLAGPVEGGAQVGMLLCETREPKALIGSIHLRRRPLRERAVIVGMAGSEHGCFALGDQMLPPLFSHWLEQAAARFRNAIL